MNARFWIWWNDGWVRLTLAPGQRMEFHTGGQTDEGFRSETETYENDGQFVRREIHSRESDCDGRHEWHSECECDVRDLKLHEADEHGPDRPVWEKQTSRVYDQYAEMAGY